MIGDFRLDDPDSDEQMTTAPVPAAASAGTGAAPPTAEPAGAEVTHDGRVRAHQAATGWSPEHALRLASVNSQIAKLQRQTPVSFGTAVLAFLAVAADLALAGFAIAWALTGDGDRAEAGVLILLAMFVPTVWAAWILTRVVQRGRVHTYRAERDRLRLERGCGDPGCPQCELSAGSRTSGG